jgi:hypothetical protein
MNPALTASADSEWNRRFADWLRCDALARADDAFGQMAQAESEFTIGRMLLAGKMGEAYLRSPAGQAERKPAKDALQAAEDRSTEAFYRPLWAAAAALAMVPAPNLSCALFKVELVRLHELDNCSYFDELAKGRTPMDVVTEDFARLNGEEAAEDPIDLYAGALSAFQAGTIDEDAYSASYDAMRDFEPQTLRDFARQFTALYDDGSSPVDGARDTMLERARRLVN